jgi:capsule polysaccharide export protein KpsE/RkpR
MEIKWLMIAWAVIMTGLFASQAYDTRATVECRTAFAQSNKTVDEINQLCKAK